jgi:hypothetical protein
MQDQDWKPRVPVLGPRWARKLRREQIVELIRQFTLAVNRPGGRCEAQRILERTIALLDCHATATRQAAAGEQAEPPALEAHAAILRELKAVLEVWDPVATGPLPLEVAHAMDSLLMNEARWNERLKKYTGRIFF